MNPYPDKDFANDRERWEEAEAQFCDQMVAQYQTTVAEHTKKLMTSATSDDSKFAGMMMHLHAAPIAHITSMAHAWQQMADHLRRPRRARIERTNYE